MTGGPVGGFSLLLYCIALRLAGFPLNLEHAATSNNVRNEMEKQNVIRWSAERWTFSKAGRRATWGHDAV